MAKIDRKEKKENTDENRKTFEDETFSSWYTEDDGNIKIGVSLARIMKGECETISVRDMFYGDKSNTWRIVITTDDKMILLKSSRELK